MKAITLIVVLLVLIPFTGCEKVEDEIVPAIQLGEVTDIDGNVYVTARIGDQTWMAENLKVTNYSNGDPITITDDATSNSEWTEITTEAGCYYRNNASNVNEYGILYNWFAATDTRNIAPDGWHVPTDDDWKELESYLGMPDEHLSGSDDRGTDEGKKLKGVEAWDAWRNNPMAQLLGDSAKYKGTDEWGFNATPAPFRFGTNGYFDFSSIEQEVNYWTASAYSNSEALTRNLYWGTPQIDRETEDKRAALTIRCVKD